VATPSLSRWSLSATSAASTRWSVSCRTTLEASNPSPNAPTGIATGTTRYRDVTVKERVLLGLG
jgi:hypothetical protein